MEQVTHDAGCIAAQEQWKRDAAAYDAAWPKHCQECHGAGGKAVKYDPSPAGVALSPGYYTEFEPCPECYDKGVCPRCAGKMAGEGDEIPETCPHCQWKVAGGCGAPAQPECWCWEEQMYRAEHPNYEASIND